MKKKWMILLAVALTLLLAVFQRATGPTHDAGGVVERNGEKVGFSLPRSGTVGSDTRIALPSDALSRPDSEAWLFYRYYPAGADDEYACQPMRWEDGNWVGFLPSQPMAGKLSYYVKANGREYFSDDPLVIRYRGEVPAGILVPHILFMFMAMFFAVMAGLAALFNDPLCKRYSLFTLLLLVAGGFVFGCLVQKHAFDVYWAGFPAGGDLTDNKTLIAVLAFLAAVLVQAIRKKSRWVVLAASVIMLGVFCIPHSANGSELDRSSGEIVSGK